MRGEDMRRLPYPTALGTSVAVLLAIAWTISSVRPLAVHFARTQQDVFFLELDGVRFRLLHQWFGSSTSPPPGLVADALAPLTITLRNTAGQMVALSGDPNYRDAKNRWWFDENAGNHIMQVGGPLSSQYIDLRLRFVCAPVWFLFALALVPLLYHVTKTWLFRRIPPGHCQKCGYNLTGNVSGICPECGERI
jgi:hypothetical protein